MIHPIKSIEAHYQTWAAKHFTFTKESKKIKDLKGLNKGNVCFVIGNGPSLKAEDLCRLYELGIPSFAANRIYKIFNKTDWRPTYFSCEDPIIIRDIEKEINEISCQYKFIPIDLKWYHEININNAYYFNMDYRRNDNIDYGFYDELSERVTCNGTVTITAIQFAVYMGYTEIYLIGVDHSYAKMIDSNGNVIEDKSIKDYFDDSYDDGINNDLVHNMDDATKSFFRTKQHFSPKGIHIYNATRGGKLEVFPRVDLDTFFKEYKK